jgi:hypothetical protein
MKENTPVVNVAVSEMLEEWEGPAILEPGVLFDPSQREHLAGEADIVAIASWVGITVLRTPLNQAAYDAKKKEVLSFLSRWRKRHGQAKLDEVKQQLFDLVQKRRNHRKMTEAETHNRIESLFDEIPG